MFCVCFPFPCPVYTATSGGFPSTPNPDVFFASTTALPEKIITPFSSRSATGRCCQCTKSGLTACPQLM
jgi:hypothetical protein